MASLYLFHVDKMRRMEMEPGEGFEPPLNRSTVDLLLILYSIFFSSMDEDGGVYEEHGYEERCELFRDYDTREVDV